MRIRWEWILAAGLLAGAASAQETPALKSPKEKLRPISGPVGRSVQKCNSLPIVHFAHGGGHAVAAIAQSPTGRHVYRGTT